MDGIHDLVIGGFKILIQIRIYISSSSDAAFHDPADPQTAGNICKTIYQVRLAQRAHVTQQLEYLVLRNLRSASVI